MKYIAIAVAAFCVAGTQAASCNYFTDDACQYDANNGTSYECAYETPIASSGVYVQCQATSDFQDSCTISRCSDANCSDIVNSFTVVPTNGLSSCTYTGGPGPYYEEYQNNQA